MTTSVTRPCFTTQHQSFGTKTKTKTDIFWSETGIVLRPTVLDHITGEYKAIVTNEHSSKTVFNVSIFCIQKNAETQKHQPTKSYCRTEHKTKY